jgi:hypothetical protein
MTEREKRLGGALLAILAAGLSIVGLQLYAASRSEQKARLSSLRRELVVMRKLAAALPSDHQRLEELKAEVVVGESHHPANLFILADSLAKDIRKKGLSIQRSAIAGAGEKAVLQFSIKGEMVSLLSIAKAASTESGFSMLSLRIQTDPDGAEPVLSIRMTYGKK